jgi:hypothetical protein
MRRCRAIATSTVSNRPARAYHKDDQAWVEQKNGAVLRRLAGYGRQSGLAAASALQRLYENARLYVNFFQPSFKLASKQREGAVVHKRYHPPRASVPAAARFRCGRSDRQATIA